MITLAITFYLRVDDIKNPVELREEMGILRGNVPAVIFVENGETSLFPRNVALFSLGGRIWITKGRIGSSDVQERPLPFHRRRGGHGS